VNGIIIRSRTIAIGSCIQIRFYIYIADCIEYKLIIE